MSSDSTPEAVTAPAVSVTETNETSSSSSSSSTTSNNFLSSFQTAANSMNKGIRAISTNFDANIKETAAGISAAAVGFPGAAVAAAVNAATSVGSGITTTTAAAITLTTNSTNQVPMLPTPIDKSTFAGNELIYRTRDMRKSTDALSRKFLTREVEYAGSSSQAYAKLLKEVHNSKSVLRPLSHSSAELASRVGQARLLAAALANGGGSGGAVAVANMTASSSGAGAGGIVFEAAS